jgi:hypothetical protein
MRTTPEAPDLRIDTMVTSAAAAADLVVARVLGASASP